MPDDPILEMKQRFIAVMQAAFPSFPYDDIEEKFSSAMLETYAKAIAPMDLKNVSPEKPFRIIDIGCGGDMFAYGYIVALLGGDPACVTWLGVDPSKGMESGFNDIREEKYAAYLQAHEGGAEDMPPICRAHPRMFSRKGQVDLVVMQSPMLNCYPLSSEEYDSCFQLVHQILYGTDPFNEELILSLKTKLAKEPDLLNMIDDDEDDDPIEAQYKNLGSALLRFKTWAAQADSYERIFTESLPGLLHAETAVCISPVHAEEFDRLPAVVKKSGMTIQQEVECITGLSTTCFICVNPKAPAPAPELESEAAKGFYSSGSGRGSPAHFKAAPLPESALNIPEEQLVFGVITPQLDFVTELTVTDSSKYPYAVNSFIRSMLDAGSPDKPHNLAWVEEDGSLCFMIQNHTLPENEATAYSVRDTEVFFSLVQATIDSEGFRYNKADTQAAFDRCTEKARETQAAVAERRRNL